MSPDQTSPGVDFEAKTIKFDYIKGNYFRVVHVDGAVGGISPRGDINMGIWNERWPIPKQTTFELAEGGKVQKEIVEERISRDALIREVEVELVMSVEVAKTLCKWLNEKIEAATKIIDASGGGEKE